MTYGGVRFAVSYIQSLDYGSIRASVSPYVVCYGHGCVCDGHGCMGLAVGWMDGETRCASGADWNLCLIRTDALWW